MNFKKIATDLAAKSDEIINLVEEGEIDALKLKVYIAQIKKAVEKIEKGIESHAISEAEKYGQKNFSAFGYNISFRETAKYDYSGCDNWLRLEKEIKGLRNEQKNIETQLKAASQNAPYIDASGEFITAIPTIKTTSLIIK